MLSKITWREGLSFEGSSGTNTLTIDAKSPLGKGTGPTPKELVALGLAGCSGMDVISLLKKYKQNPQSFSIDVEVDQTEDHQYPVIFKNAHLIFKLEGQIAQDKLEEAVTLSMTKFCGVAAMIVKACPVTYTVLLNGAEIQKGEAVF